MSQDMNVSENSQNLPQYRSIALVAAGSNTPIGGKSLATTIDRALQQLCDKGGMIRSVSRYFSTPAFPVGSGPDFVNAAFVWCSDLAPLDVLTALHDVESAFGRVRTDRWAPRTLDLDLIAIDNAVYPDAATVSEWISLPLEEQQRQAPPQMLLPHPRVQDRAFVLVPLCDVAPDWTHPILGKTAQQMRDALPQDVLDSVIPLEKGENPS